MEKIYGKGAVFQLSKTANREYFTGRSYADIREPPLYLSKGQSYLSYGKGYTVMLALKVLLGEEKMNSLLKNLLSKNQDAVIPKVTASDFLREIYTIAPKQYHQLINDWLKRVITYDLKVEKTSCRRLKNGRYETTIDIVSQRFETRKNGKEPEISINEPIPVGIFLKHPSEMNQKNQALYLRQHLINKKYSRLKIITDQKPEYIAIDPFGTRTEENRTDNIIKI